jgi:hypothetical protein
MKFWHRSRAFKAGFWACAGVCSLVGAGCSAAPSDTAATSGSPSTPSNPSPAPPGNGATGNGSTGNGMPSAAAPTGGSSNEGLSGAPLDDDSASMPPAGSGVNPNPSTDPPMEPSATTPGVNCLAGTGDYASDGPYAVATEVVDLGAGIADNQATGEFTIFYPEPFEAGCTHPIVAWGNGTGVTGPDVYEFFNHNAASWGMVVIAAHDSNTGSGEYHLRGIDYLLAQNADPSSKFFGKLSPRAGVSGHSQGGFGASRAASHPNVEALVPVGASGQALATSAFLCLTGTEDIAPDSCRASVNAAPGPAMVAIWEGGDHVGTETLLGYITGDPGTVQMMRLYAAWFRCFLADDGAACEMFRGGASCGICDDAGWAEVLTKNL